MFSLRRSAHFLRKAGKLLKKQPRLERKIDQVTHLLELSPFAPSLKTHNVIAKVDKKPAKSSFVTKDLRIIWRFDGKQISLINLIDIGGHSGKGKVYK